MPGFPRCFLNPVGQDELEGPVMATYIRIADLPPGSCLVAAGGCEQQPAPAHVEVISRADEASRPR